MLKIKIKNKKERKRSIAKVWNIIVGPRTLKHSDNYDINFDIVASFWT